MAEFSKTSALLLNGMLPSHRQIEGLCFGEPHVSVDQSVVGLKGLGPFPCCFPGKPRRSQKGKTLWCL